MLLALFTTGGAGNLHFKCSALTTSARHERPWTGFWWPTRASFTKGKSTRSSRVWQTQFVLGITLSSFGVTFTLVVSLPRLRSPCYWTTFLPRGQMLSSLSPLLSSIFTLLSMKMLTGHCGPRCHTAMRSVRLGWPT